MMTILSVAYPFAVVSPATAGGAEQVLLQMDAALIQAGHRSLVIAPLGSTVQGELLPIPRFAPEQWKEGHAAVRQAIADTVGSEHIDAIHLHGGDFHAYIPEGPVPVLATLHLPPEWYPSTVFGDCRVVLHCVSEAQQQRCPAAGNLLPPIANGVDPEFYRPARNKHNYALALGRICPEKGVHHAIDAARAAGVPLIVAGEVFRYTAHLDYYRREIEPRKPKFIGPAGPERKRRLLAGARCVLVPSLAPETSSLVAMEAQACGTPVVAFPSGALSTIVKNGETGFVVPDAPAMAEAIRNTATLDPRKCRDYAVRNFDIRRTAGAYMDAYRTLSAEWRNLFQRSPEVSPFLHPAWQDSWWSIFGTGRRFAFRVRRSGRLAAIATFYSHNDRLVFTGNGMSDRLGILAEDDKAAAELVQQIARYPLDLQEIPSGSALLTLPHQQCSVCPVVDLNRPLPAKLSRHLAQQRRYFGLHRFETVSDPSSVETLFELHTRLWESRGERGMLHDERIRAFHRLSAPRLAEAGLLRIHTLSAGGRRIAILYGLSSVHTMHYCLSGFDPAYERFSPGSLLVEHAMTHARQSGQRWFDFLRGAEPYKYRWGAVDQPQFRIGG